MNPPALRASRILGLVAVLVLLGLLLSALFVQPAQAVSYSTEEAEFVQLLNDYRVSNGLEPLLVSDVLSLAAERHCSDMAKYHFFDHYTTGGSDWFPVGSSPWDRMAACGYDFRTTKGENLAAGQDTAAAVFADWKSSPGHNANMLSPDFQVIGVAYLRVSGADYDCYWTTDFGRYVDETAHQLGSPAPAPSTPTPPSPTPPIPADAAPAGPVVPQPSEPAAPAPSQPEAPIPSKPAASPVPSSGFADVDSGTLYSYEIAQLAELGIVRGFADGTFKPTDPITRQQFAKMIALAIDLDVRPVTATGFDDIQTGLDQKDPLYPASYVAACVKAGIVQGKTDGSFAPYDRVIRAQLITMVARAAGLPTAGEPEAPFADFSPDHYPWAARAWAAGLLEGIEGMGADYAFWADATRAEACALLCNLMGLAG